MVKRELGKRKKPKVVLPPRRLRRSDDLVDEPTWESPVESLSDSRLARAFSYYNYLDVKDRGPTMRRWLVEHCRTSGLLEPREIAVVEAMEDWRIGTSAPALARMMSRGLVLPKEAVDRHVQRIRDEISRYEQRAREEAARPKRDSTSEGPRYSRSAEVVGAVIADVEELLDRGETPSLYETLTAREMSQPQASTIRDYFSRVLDEYKAIKSDPQLKEGYSHLGRSAINKIVSDMTAIVSDAERYALNRRTARTRRPRKKREKSAVQVVSRMQYLKSHSELKLVSVDPSTIVGSGTVYVYNVKYKTLRRLCATGESGLEVRGSTIHGFDLKTSEQRSLRKPEATLPLILEGNSAACKRVMSELTTKPTEPNGRINSECVILKTMRQR